MAAISAVACLLPPPPAEYVTLMNAGSSFASSCAIVRADHAQLALRREDLERNRLRARLTGLREDVIYGIHNAAFYHIPSSVSLALLIITTQAFPSSVIPGTGICFIQKATYLPTRLPGGSSTDTQQASIVWRAFVNAILPINMSPSRYRSRRLHRRKGRVTPEAGLRPPLYARRRNQREDRIRSRCCPFRFDETR